MIFTTSLNNPILNVALWSANFLAFFVNISVSSLTGTPLAWGKGLIDLCRKNKRGFLIVHFEFNLHFVSSVYRLRKVGPKSGIR